MEEVTQQNFEEFVKNGNSIIDFWAQWCGPCKQLGPIFDELSNEMENINFGKVDVDSEGELAGNAGVRGVPTLILFKEGKEIDRIVGAMPKEALKQKIESAFK